MKNKWNCLLLAGCILSAVLCAAIWNLNEIYVLCLSAVPFFCLQLLLCRVTRIWWLRAIPEVPVAVLLLMAGFYFFRDSGWDRLGALVFGLAAIAPAVGCLLGWGVWGVPILRRRREEKHQG